MSKSSLPHYAALTAVAFAFLLAAQGCHEQVNHLGRTPLAEVEGRFLYREDLLRVIPLGLSSEDSIRFAEEYIRNWIEDELFYVNAERNVPDLKEIDLLVENYRRSLIMHTYQQAMVQQKSIEQITPEQIQAFYDENPGMFTAEEPLVKGLYIKMPLTTRLPNLFRLWNKKNNTEALEELEKFVFRNAVDYDYFNDRWVSLDRLLDRLPEDKLLISDFVLENRWMETTDTTYRYLLNLTEVVKKGEVKPLDCVENEIRDILTNQQQTRFINQLKSELFDLATEKKKIKHYHKAKEND